MKDLRDKRKLPHIEVTTTTLKWYACIMLLFYAISMTVIQRGILGMDGLSGVQLQESLAQQSDQMILSSWAVVFQLLGGLGIPVVAFLLVEGFHHTESLRAYLIRMLLFAFLSEVPYDYAMTGTLFYGGSQNLLFTLVLGLIMLYGLRLFEARKAMKALIIVAAVLWSLMVKCQFGLCMILLIAVYHLMRDKKEKLLVGGIISLMYVTGPLSNFVLKQYNRELGEHPNKYLFYCLYPAHLAILGLVVRYLGA